jgi:heme-containing dehydratase-like protein
MRDRIPLSQTDEMGPGGRPALKRDGSRLRIVPHDNLCLIRSGQNWSETDAPERKLYLEEVEPVLREGMDFLRDDGLRTAAMPTATCPCSAPTGGRRAHRRHNLAAARQHRIRRGASFHQSTATVALR